MLIAIVFRLIFIVSLPVLSDDYYRFIWDGCLSEEFINPFSYTPNYYIENFEKTECLNLVLHEQLNSKDYFSVYPIICQFVFWLSIKFFRGNEYWLYNVIVIRVILLAMEFLVLWTGFKLFSKHKIPIKSLSWYVINPLVIIELIGNLHFEGMMIAFFILSMYCLYHQKYFLSTLWLSISIATKLLPIMILPLLYKVIPSLKKRFVYYILVAGFSFVLLAPLLYSSHLGNFWQSLELYFKNFEFNASFYYLIRWIGYKTQGYNIIEIVGKSLAIIPFVSIIIMSLYTKSFRELYIFMLFAIAIRYFTSTTVHPWYLTTLIILVPFTNYKFPIFWSWLSFLSYSAYANDLVKENLTLIFIEYFALYTFIVIEILYRRGILNKIIKKRNLLSSRI